MKKRILMVLAAAMVAVSGFAADRAHTLKVYNWADYIDMDNVLNSFPDWYKAQTGEDLSLDYREAMSDFLTEISKEESPCLKESDVSAPTPPSSS